METTNLTPPLNLIKRIAFDALHNPHSINIHDDYFALFLCLYSRDTRGNGRGKIRGYEFCTRCGSCNHSSLGFITGWTSICAECISLKKEELKPLSRTYLNAITLYKRGIIL